MGYAELFSKQFIIQFGMIRWQIVYIFMCVLLFIFVIPQACFDKMNERINDFLVLFDRVYRNVRNKKFWKKIGQTFKLSFVVLIKVFSADSYWHFFSASPSGKKSLKRDCNE